MAEERKPASKAQQKAQNRWIASAYDRINLTVEKGRKDIIKAFADAQGESVNGFINRAVNAAMSGEQAAGGRSIHRYRDRQGCKHDQSGEISAGIS